MKFSVIIPVYNSSDTIKDVLDSVKNQTFKDFEICLVNDGSTDNSAEIINDFIASNPNIKITFINSENNGVSKARNIGIDCAVGDYIALLDADDVWHPQKLELMVELINPKYVFYGHSCTIDDFGKFYKYETSFVREYSFTDFLLKNRFVTPSVVFVNNKKHFFDESMHYAEDHDLWLRLCHEHKALFLNLPLVRLNRPVLSAGGASSSKWKMRKGEIKMYNNLVDKGMINKVYLPLLIIFSLLKHIKGYFK